MSMIRNKKAGAEQVVVEAAQDNRRIDNFLMKKLGNIPRSRIYQMLRRGEIRVNGGRVKQGYRLAAGDQVRIPPVFQPQRGDPQAPPAYLLEQIRNTVIYEDDDILVLNKPSGIVVHGGSGRDFGVIELLRVLRPAEADLQLAHRLDQETSGCLIITRQYPALKQVHEALRAGQVKKRYLALLKGSMSQGDIHVSRSLRRNRLESGERMVRVDEQGKAAETLFEPQETLQGATLARVTLYTGRTHQIRVHAAHLGHPVAGDTKYGDRDFNRDLKHLGLKRMFLHASELSIPGPGKLPLEFRAPLPDQLNNVLNKLRNNK